MHILILGSGVIGVTSAYYLSRAGHEITLVDRQPEPALETSFANAGQVSWGYASPWAAPGVPLNALKWMFQKHSPFVLRLRADPIMWRWLAHMLGNCRRARYQINKERMIRLARYSHGCLQALRHNTGITYDERAGGVLQLLRDAHGMDAARHDVSFLERSGIPCKALNRAECLAVEPGLGQAQALIAGGVHFPEDETGDCHKFTQALAQRNAQLGVRFQPSTTIRRIAVDDGRVEHVLTDTGKLRADAYVVAAGSYSPLLLRPLNIMLPVYPVKGYSVTVPIVNAHCAPVSTLTDETYKVAVTRLGDRIRAAGTAELAGYDLQVSPRHCHAVVHVLRELFPAAGDLARAEYWTGLRPMTPDNAPVIGRTPYRNLYLNTGHGTLGWTMSCGSGRVLADIISRHTPEIDMTGLTLARYL